MLNANGENRRYLALAFGCALATAVGTKVGEWTVERVRKLAKDPAAPVPPSPATPPSVETPTPPPKE